MSAWPGGRATRRRSGPWRGISPKRRIGCSAKRRPIGNPRTSAVSSTGDKRAWPHELLEARPLNRRRQLEGGPNPLFERVHLPAQFLDLPEQLLAGVRRVWREELEALPQERAAPYAEAIAHLQVVESVLGQRGMNPVLELRALPDKHQPGARQVTLVPQLPGRNPDRRERATPLQPVESPHVELIRLVDLPHHQLRLARVH